MNLRAGDYFAVSGTSLIAKLIRLKQRLSSLDSKAEFNHAGIILDDCGNTFESLGHIDHYHIDQYVGRPIMIARYHKMDPERFESGMKEVLRYDGKIYPFWRLLLHLIGLGKFFRLTFPVCSELVGEHAYFAGVHNARGWGWNPDNLADLWDISKYVDVLYKGTWKGVKGTWTT